MIAGGATLPYGRQNSKNKSLKSGRSIISQGVCVKKAKKKVPPVVNKSDMTYHEVHWDS